MHHHDTGRFEGAGKIRAYGLGHLSPERARDFLKRGDVSTILMELSAVATESRDTLLPLCAEYDAAAIAFSVTGRGLLASAFAPGHRFDANDIRALDPLFQRERFASGLRVAKKLAEIGGPYGKTAAQVAIAWVLAQPHVLCALTGPSKPVHLEENLMAADWTLPQEERKALDAYLAVERSEIAKAQTESVRCILANPLPANSDEAFADLVYALETGLQLGWVTEREVMPIFQVLFELRADGNIGSLKGIKTQLGELVDYLE